MSAHSGATGVAQAPIEDMDAYRDQLQSFVYASGTTMRPIFATAKVAHLEDNLGALRGRLLEGDVEVRRRPGPDR